MKVTDVVLRLQRDVYDLDDDTDEPEPEQVEDEANGWASFLDEHPELEGAVWEAGTRWDGSERPAHYSYGYLAGITDEQILRGLLRAVAANPDAEGVDAHQVLAAMFGTLDEAVASDDGVNTELHTTPQKVGVKLFAMTHAKSGGAVVRTRRRPGNKPALWTVAQDAGDDHMCHTIRDGRYLCGRPPKASATTHTYAECEAGGHAKCRVCKKLR